MNLNQAFSKVFSLLSEKDETKAINILRKIIGKNPDFFDAVELLALLYLQKNQINALKNLLINYENNPRVPNKLLFNLGTIYLDEKKYLQAIKIFQKLNTEQTEYEIKVQLGLSYVGLKEFHLASKYFEEAWQLKDNSVEACLNYGAILRNIGDYKKSLLVLEKAKNLDSNDPRVWLNLGTSQDIMGNHLEAISNYRKALILDPNYQEVYTNMGNSYLALGNFESAKEAYEKALYINPRDSESLFSLAIVQLSDGNYSEGWKNYESRFNILHGPKKIFGHINQLTNLKENNTDKTILVWSEQGFGDTIHFSRFVLDLVDRFKNITFLVQPELFELMSFLSKKVKICSCLEDKEFFDYQIPLLSLPLLFDIGSENIPSQIPYISVDPIKNRFWEKELHRYRGFRVGIVWNGGLRKNQPELWGINNRRNISFGTISQLFELNNVNFFSLQKNDHLFIDNGEETKNLQQLTNFHDYSYGFKNFTDTAAFIKNLDLVISVDTAVAHLAGALGKPVWIMNRLDGCWRWIRGSTTSSWYPTARIFNQKEAYQWEPVIMEIKSELNKIVNKNFIASSCL